MAQVYVVNLKKTRKQNLQNQHQRHLGLSDKNLPTLTWRKGMVL